MGGTAKGVDMHGALGHAAEFQMWLTFAVIIAAFVLYAYEKVAIEVTSLGVLCVLMIFFHVFPVLTPNPNGGANGDVNALSPDRKSVV